MVRIQYKCLVPIYVFPDIKMSVPKQSYNVLSLSFYTHMSVRDLYISRIGCLFPAGKYVDRSWEYINRSQTHEYGNWDWGRAIPRKGIHKGNFPCSVFMLTEAQSIPRDSLFKSCHKKKKIRFEVWGLISFPNLLTIMLSHVCTLYNVQNKEYIFRHDDRHTNANKFSEISAWNLL